MSSSVHYWKLLTLNLYSIFDGFIPIPLLTVQSLKTVLTTKNIDFIEKASNKEQTLLSKQINDSVNIIENIEFQATHKCNNI